MSEFGCRTEPYRRSRILLIPLATAAFSLLGCGSGDKPHTVEVGLDFSKLNPDGQTCEGGDLRPCFEPVRTEPNRKPDNYVNRVINGPNGPEAEWPYEGKDKLTVVCQVKGGVVHNAKGEESTIWDVVKVPAEHLNETALEGAAGNQPGFGVIKNEKGEVTAIFGFAPDIWLGNHGVYDELDRCTPTENPQGFESIK